MSKPNVAILHNHEKIGSFPKAGPSYTHTQTSPRKCLHSTHTSLGLTLTVFLVIRYVKVVRAQSSTMLALGLIHMLLSFNIPSPTKASL
jgi:hypothetical protein